LNNNVVKPCSCWVNDLCYSMHLNSQLLWHILMFVKWYIKGQSRFKPTPLNSLFAVILNLDELIWQLGIGQTFFQCLKSDFVYFVFIKLFSNLIKCYVDLLKHSFYKFIQHSWNLKYIHDFNHVNLSSGYMSIDSF